LSLLWVDSSIEADTAACAYLTRVQLGDLAGLLFDDRSGLGSFRTPTLRQHLATASSFLEATLKARGIVFWRSTPLLARSRALGERGISTHSGALRRIAPDCQCACRWHAWARDTIGRARFRCARSELPKGNRRQGSLLGGGQTELLLKALPKIDRASRPLWLEAGGHALSREQTSGDCRK
jgi:hypothetical protein